MASKEYSLIQEEDAIDEVSTHHHDKDLGFRKRRQLGSGIVSTTLALSLATNVILIILHFLREPHGVSLNKTAFAGLERNKPVAWTDDSDFASHNRTTWDQAWETLNPDTGFVAISDDLAMRTGLHESQRWPWDSSKGLYLLQGYHSLHCLTILRTSLTEMHDKKPQSLHFTHVNHCLDGLRQEIMCNADDTPRYSGLDQNMGTGNGQYRMCKDWSKLEEWAKRHSACYEYRRGVETLRGGIPLDSFKHCPDGSEPWKESLKED